MLGFRLDLEYDLRKNYEAPRRVMSHNHRLAQSGQNDILRSMSQIGRNLVDNIQSWYRDISAGSGGLQVNY